MATCDLIEVDLSPHDFTVELNPVCYDVGIITSQVTLDYGLIAGSGPPGAPGEKGDQGDQGDPGPPGSPGLAAHVVVGTTTTGLPGSSAAVTDSDPSDNATLNFVIPRGDVGATGPAGQGINLKGSVANHAALPATGNSPGDTWVTLDTGHGWTWSGTVWNDIGPIQGPVGPPGATGPTGPAGANSTVPGPTGPTGAPGPQGNPGATGSTGPQGPAGPTVVSTDAGNVAVLGSDARIFVPDPTPVIWSQTRRFFNSVGNPTFEVDQRLAGTGTNIGPGASSVFCQDRWLCAKSAATMTLNAQQVMNSGLVLPGTNFYITQGRQVITLTAAQPTLAAGDYFELLQVVEGPQLRELINDVHSISILCLTNVSGGLNFALGLRDPGVTRSLVKLCTIPASNVWTLITLPNLPAFASGGNFSILPGQSGYLLTISFACGSTYITPANDTWQNGNFFGAIGMDNLGAKPVNSYLAIAYVQHEPGPVCSTLQDKPFTQSLEECLRCYAKSYEYGTAINTVTDDNCIYAPVPSSNLQTGVMRVNFPKPLAKKPVNLNAYSTHGGVNAAWDFSTGANKTVSALSGYSDKGFAQVVISAASTAGAVLAYHYVADTGW